ncbi:MAG: sugar phosphate isomerase/epimerase family protein [Butyrivibrio sp.]
MPEFGMPTLIETDSLEETMSLCKELGLSFVELNMNLPQYRVECLERIEYLKAFQEKYQIRYTIHLDENLNICDFNTAVAGAYMDTVERTIRVAKALNVPVLNMHMNHGVYFTLPHEKVWLFEKYFEDYMESWKRFRTVCENLIGDSGIKICIENTDGYRDYEKSAIEYLLQSRAFGLTWDIGHSNAIANIDEKFIMDNGSKLCHFHIHDSLGKNNHMTLGTGEIDLAQRLSIAKDCRCVVETKTVEALSKSVDWLRENQYI